MNNANVQLYTANVEPYKGIAHMNIAIVHLYNGNVVSDLGNVQEK